MAAQEPDWRPNLVVPADGMFSPSAAIQITLPKTLSDEVVQHLALELDNIDVTAMVSLSGNTASVTPAQPLAWGKHHLRLLEYAQDGSIIERGDWTLDVRQSKHFRESSLQTNTTLNGVYRLTENHGQTNLPARLQGNGSTSIAGAISDNNWQVSGNAGLLYNSQQQLMPRQHQNVDLAQFLLTAKAGAVTVSAGRQSTLPDSLIMQGYNRRGVTLGVSTADDMASVTGFSLHASDIVGFQQGLGIGNADNRVNGIVASYRPISNKTNALLISAMYLKGTGPQQSGVATGGTSVVGSGQADSISADGELLDKRLRLRGEYATTSYNYDYYDPNSNTHSDYAYSALVQYTPWHNKIIDGQPLAFNVGLQRTRIGTFFHSLANPTGVSDRNAVQGIANVVWNGLSSQIALGYETDNVDDLAFLPQTHTTQTVLTVGYTPPQVPGVNGQPLPMPWYGQPSYSLTYVDVHQVVDKAGSISTSTGGLQSTRNLVFSALFNYTVSSWMIMETLGRNDDLMNTGADTSTQQTQVNANLSINDKLTLGPTFQYNHTTNKSDSSKNSDSTGIGLNLTYTFSPRLAANFNYMMNHQKVNDGSSDQKTQDTTADLSWVVQSQNTSRPGITLAAEGLMHKVDDQANSNNNLDNYQINLKLTVSFASGS